MEDRRHKLSIFSRLGDYYRGRHLPVDCWKEEVKFSWDFAGALPAAVLVEFVPLGLVVFQWALIDQPIRQVDQISTRLRPQSVFLEGEPDSVDRVMVYPRTMSLQLSLIGRLANLAEKRGAHIHILHHNRAERKQVAP